MRYETADPKRTLVVSAFVFLLCLYPFVLAYSLEGVQSAFRFFAADAFYYLNVMERSSPAVGYSFDGEFPTNGFHPLWQFLLTSLGAMRLSQESQVLAVFGASATLVATASAIIAAAFLRRFGSVPLAILTSVPGPLAFAFAATDINFGNALSFANGMESGLSLLWFSILLHMVLAPDFFTSRTPGRLVGASILLGLMVLSRLDDVYICVAMALAVVLARRGAGIPFRALAALLAVPAAAIAAYLAYNLSYVDMLMPASGVVKSTFAAGANLRTAFDIFFPVIELYSDKWNHWDDRAWRTLFVFLPPIIAGWAALRSLSGRGRGVALSEGQSLAVFFATYVLIKFLHNFIVVDFWNQGYWYFPISLAIANFIVAGAVAAHFGTRSTSMTGAAAADDLDKDAILFIAAFAVIAAFAAKIIVAFESVPLAVLLLAFGVVSLCAAAVSRLRVGRVNPRGVAAAAAIALAFSNAMVFHKIEHGYNDAYHYFWRSAARIRADLSKIDPAMRLVSYDDGIVAYALGFTTLSGLGFALDREGVEAFTDGRLLELAERRGYSRLASLRYLPQFKREPVVGTEITDTVDLIWLSEREKARYRFFLDYRDPVLGFLVVSFKRKD